MSVTTEVALNTQIKAPFVSHNNVTGLVSFSDAKILKDGVLTPMSITFNEIGNGLYMASFLPTTTGLYVFFIETQIQGVYRVVNKTSYSFLQNLEDVAIGSWSWDKNTGILTFKRQDGTTLAGFDVVDNLTTASRSRSSP